MADAAHNPPPPGIDSQAGSSPDFGAPVPVELGAPPPLETVAPPTDGDVEGTARLMVGGVDALCRWLGKSEAARPVQWELSEEERGDLQRDLTPVLQKYGVEAIPYADEMQLGITFARTVGPRLRRYQHEKEHAHDHPVARQEGGVQDRPAPEAGTPPARGSSEVARLLE